MSNETLDTLIVGGSKQVPFWVHNHDDREQPN
jgi:hypothetical protein